MKWKRQVFLVLTLALLAVGRSLQNARHQHRTGLAPVGKRRAPRGLRRSRAFGERRGA